jgi:hypothetical protein
MEGFIRMGNPSAVTLRGMPAFQAASHWDRVFDRVCGPLIVFSSEKEGGVPPTFSGEGVVLSYEP